MFLHLLKEDTKEKFLELIYKVATCDGEYSEDEAEVVNNYKIELGISEIKQTGTVDELIAYFSKEEKTIRKVVYFEVYGLIIVDDKTDPIEESVMRSMRKELTLSETEYDLLEKAVDQLQSAYDTVYSAIFD